MKKINLDNGAVIGIIVTLVSSACSVIFAQYLEVLAVASLIIAAILVFYLFARRDNETTKTDFDSDNYPYKSIDENDQDELRFSRGVALIFLIVYIAFFLYCR